MFPDRHCLETETAELVPAGILPMPGSLDLGKDFVEQIRIPWFLQRREIALFEPISQSQPYEIYSTYKGKGSCNFQCAASPSRSKFQVLQEKTIRPKLVIL